MASENIRISKYQCDQKNSLCTERVTMKKHPVDEKRVKKALFSKGQPVWEKLNDVPRSSSYLQGNR